jgi:hypothetical protein
MGWLEKATERLSLLAHKDMESIMRKILSYFLSKHCAKIVKQSFDHKLLMIAYYRRLVDAAREEFTEENTASLNCFLRECFEASLKT